MSAVSIVDDDRFWPSFDPEQWHREVAEYLAERDADAAKPMNTLVSVARSLRTRRGRRFVQLCRLRSIRPRNNPEALKTGWHKHKKGTPPAHPRYGYTKLELVPDDSGQLVSDVRRHVPKPAPNRRHESVPTIETVPQIDETVDAATTQVTESDELMESDVVLEQSSGAELPTAVVIVPRAQEYLIEPDGLDSELVSLLSGEIAEDVLELPVGFHLLDGDGDYAGGYFSRRQHLERLQEAAETEPDWGDPELWERFRHETAQLIVRM